MGYRVACPPGTAVPRGRQPRPRGVAWPPPTLVAAGHRRQARWGGGGHEGASVKGKLGDLSSIPGPHVKVEGSTKLSLTSTCTP